MKKIITFISIAILLIVSFNSYAQTGTSSCFILISPLGENNTYLIDTLGNLYNQWNCDEKPGSTAYLLEDGSIMRPCRVSNPSMVGGAVGGEIEIRDWNNNVTWEYTWSNTSHQQHHEAIPIKKSNGTYNALIISWELKTNSEAIQAGRQSISNEMWPTEIIEIEPNGSNGGNVVWEWHAWDHLCQDVDSTKNNYYTSCDDHPELIDINLGSIMSNSGDWLHSNGIDYSPVLDQIVFSSHSMDEIFVIDHSTTTAEASTHSGGNAGKGGNILYRWGNPENYGAGTSSDRILYVCHGSNFIDEGFPGAGNIMIFNNGDRSGFQNDYSVVEEITAPLNGYNYTLPWNQSQIWTYSEPTNFYSNHLSGAFRLKNGNTLATEGTSARVIEVSPSGQTVFEYSVSDFNAQLAKAVGYELDYPGLIGLYSSVNEIDVNTDFSVYPNPFTESTTISFNRPSQNGYSMKLINMTADVLVQRDNIYDNTIELNRESLVAGMYIIEIKSDNSVSRKKIIIQ